MRVIHLTSTYIVFAVRSTDPKSKTRDSEGLRRLKNRKIKMSMEQSRKIFSKF